MGVASGWNIWVWLVDVVSQSWGNCVGSGEHIATSTNSACSEYISNNTQCSVRFEWSKILLEETVTIWFNFDEGRSVTNTANILP